MTLNELIPDQQNANMHTKKGMSLLKRSLKRNGAGRSILLSADNEVIAGNGVTEAALAAGMNKVRVIETDGTEIIAVKRTDIKSGTKEFFDMALADNGIAKENIAMDMDVVEVLCETYDIDPVDCGFDMSPGGDGEDTDEKPEKHIWVPDCLFPSDNEFDIPVLKKHDKPFYVELPLRGYGVEARSKKGVGTYHFYVDDYKFNAIWDDPSKIIQSGVSAIVEPNTSLYETTPIGFGIFQIYKKRWVARFLQDYNINVFVDLNVCPKFSVYNRMGVPDGYNAFFTRGYEGRISDLENELNIAKSISGLDNPNLIVYGGSKKVKTFCNKHSLTYIENTKLELKGENA